MTPVGFPPSPYTRADLYDLLFNSYDAEIQEMDGTGQVAHSHRFATLVRWTYPSEVDLLLRLASFARWEITGGLDGREVADHEGLIVVSAWND